MDSYNIIENENYYVNYEAIKKYLTREESKLKFAYKKFMNDNKKKKQYILGIYKEERDDEFIFLRHPMTRKIFQAFIISKEPWDINTTFNYLKCYDKCVKTLENPYKKFSPYFLRKFLEVTPNYGWEKEVEQCFKTSFMGNSLKIEALKKECIKQIENSFEMKKFIKALNYKIDKSMTEGQRLACKNNEKTIDKLIFLFEKHYWN